MRPTRMPTNEERRDFARDGVVLLRGVLPVSLVRSMEAPVADTIARGEVVDMTKMAVSLSQGTIGPQPGRFLAGTDHYARDAAFLTFAAKSALPQVVAALLESTRLWVYEDSILVKEAGANVPTEWHTDQGYFHVTGEQVVTTWVPLDVVTSDNGGMRYLRGSHLRGVTYRPNLFVHAMPIPGTTGDAVPAIDLSCDDVITFDARPGDLLVHHYRTLHGAAGNTSTTSRRAISVRYCGDDARVMARTGAPTKAHLAGLADGTSLSESAAIEASLEP